MSNPITLADLKIGSDRFVIELIENPKSQATSQTRTRLAVDSPDGDVPATVFRRPLLHTGP